MAKRTIKSDILGTKVKINSKTKGNNNERAAAKWLKEWTGADMNRTPRSGGLRWLDSSRIAGDVVAPKDFYFPFCVETKAYNKIEFKEVLRVNSIIGTFWVQADADARRIDKEPFLMVRENGMKSGEFIIFVGRINRIFSQWIFSTCSGGVVNSIGESETIIGYKSQDILKIPYQEFVEDYQNGII